MGRLLLSDPGTHSLQGNHLEDCKKGIREEGLKAELIEGEIPSPTTPPGSGEDFPETAERNCTVRFDAAAPLAGLSPATEENNL